MNSDPLGQRSRYEIARERCRHDYPRAARARAQLAAPNDLGVAFGHVHLSVADVGVHEELWTRLFDAVLAEKAGFSAVRIPGTLVFFTAVAFKQQRHLAFGRA